MATKTYNVMYRWMRLLHRDLGFFLIGVTVIYCVSGILLIYRDTGFLKHESQVTKTLQPNLSENELLHELNLRRAKILAVDAREIRFTGGSYDLQSGVASYVTTELPQLLNAMNQLHVAPSQDTRHRFTVLYALALLFLALSSFWMYRPGTAHFKRAIAIAAAGSAASLALILV